MLSARPAQADELRDAQYWLTQYGFTTAWASSRGAGMTVAVIDSGIDGSVADLSGTVIGGADFSGGGSSNGQTPVGDDPSHGTLVASLLAGHGPGLGNADGVIGVAPEAKLLSVSVGFGTGAIDSDEQIAKAVRWSVDNGANIINMSLTRNTLDWPESWDSAFLYAMKKDVVIVAAAGNRGSGTTVVGAPATMPGVVTVAGVGKDSTASFDASSQGITIAVAAPSESLVGAGPANRYYEWAGTSGATPLVAGLVALIWAKHRQLDATNVINRLIQTSTPTGQSRPSPIYGYGLINAAAAVTAPVVAVTRNPMGSLSEWIRIHRRASAAPSAAPSAASTRTQPDKSAGAVPVPEASGSGVGTEQNPWLPTPQNWRETWIPLGVLATFGCGATIAIRAFRREARLARRK
ncbi:MAG: S8 family serine peptidase [Microbacteriaceae bacterium]|nr:S8 family serine peptidase [Microbacteriaceae bacterium]